MLRRKGTLMLGCVFKQNDRTETQMKKTEMTATPCLLFVFYWRIIREREKERMREEYMSLNRR